MKEVVVLLGLVLTDVTDPCHGWGGLERAQVLWRGLPLSIPSRGVDDPPGHL